MIELKDNAFNIIVKPNSPKNEITGFDKTRNAYKINIKAKPENNKTNIEIIRFFSKLFGIKVNIIKGLKSKYKTLKIG